MLIRIAVLAAALLPGSACASTRAAPAELVMSCERLASSAPEGTSVAREDMPRILNAEDVHRRLTWLYKRQTSRRAVLQLLVQPTGTVSHGCVRMPSGEPEFDEAALQSAEVARFRPAHLNGEAVEAWVAMPVSVGM